MTRGWDYSGGAATDGETESGVQAPPPAIDAIALRPGDVLLSSSDDPLSAFIRELDGSEYSHAGIWSGDGVIEAVRAGIIERTLEECIEKSERTVVDAYRHRTASASLAAVAQARRQVGKDYPLRWASILGAVCSLVRLVPRPISGSSQVAHLGQRVVEQLREADADKCMSCCELVAQAYLDAGVRLQVDAVRRGHFAAGSAYTAASKMKSYKAERGFADGDSTEWESLVNEIADAYEQLVGQSPPLGEADLALALRHYGRIRRVGEDWSPAFVTPYQLATSPDFERLGRLHHKGAASAA